MGGPTFNQYKWVSNFEPHYLVGGRWATLLRANNYGRAKLAKGVIAMCYGMGCRWEDSTGECRAPRSILGYLLDEESCLCVPRDEEEEYGEEREESEEWEEE